MILSVNVIPFFTASDKDKLILSRNKALQLQLHRLQLTIFLTYYRVLTFTFRIMAGQNSMGNILAPFNVICFIVVLIINVGSSTANSSLFRDYYGSSPALKNFLSSEEHTGVKILADIIEYLKQNRPKDGQGLHLNRSEQDDLIQRIRASEYWDELRAVGKSWSERRPHLSKLPWVDPDVYYNMSGLVWSKGYPIEEYQVRTADGYILGLFRIPHGRKHTNGTCCGPAVFLQHGLLAASTNWVENLANQSLAFILADEGFDVWMGNMRGNTYSRRHAWLDPDKQEFWKFSWDEMAKYDIPAMVNFALAKSGQSQLAYVGHSQGTLVAFTGFAIDPTLGRRISSLVALGPIYTVAHIKLALREFVQAGLAWLLGDVLSEAGVDEFLPRNFLTNELAAQTLCAWPETWSFCANTLLFFGGHSRDRLNVSRVQVYVANEPAGTSLQNMQHFLQMVATGKCQMYDYGRKGNLIKYNQTTPPEYRVEDLAVPAALFSGANDDLADPWDVSELLPRIPRLLYAREIPNFEHLDFIWAMDAREVLYDDVISIIRGKIPPC